MIENVMLIERIIQFGNRYRATNSQVHERLLRSRRSIPSVPLCKSVEDAAKAVESVDPVLLNVLKSLYKNNYL